MEDKARKRMQNELSIQGVDDGICQCIEQLYALFAKGKARLLEDTIEPTDTEGRAYEALVQIDEQKYNVFLSAQNALSYEEQAALDIFRQIAEGKCNQLLNP